MSYHELRRLTGEAAGEVETARAAAEELAAAAHRAAVLVRDFTELRELVTVADAVRLRDALATLRQVEHALARLARKNRNGPLADAFGIPLLKVEEWRRRTEKRVALLLRWLEPPARAAPI